jgi:hypothetical protein
MMRAPIAPGSTSGKRGGKWSLELENCRLSLFDSGDARRRPRKIGNEEG